MKVKLNFKSMKSFGTKRKNLIKSITKRKLNSELNPLQPGLAYRMFSGGIDK